ncbi:MAG: peptidylprolyl isomerase [Thermoanaerobaculia bacterium]|nr:peptidylprolyl isomerase [Thermoanaerobaculia bacterium]
MTLCWTNARRRCYPVLIPTLTVSALLLGACSREPGHQEPSADTIATFDGGTIGLAAVEARMATTTTKECRAVRRAQGSASIDLLVPCYQNIGRALALERLIAAETEDLGRSLKDLGAAYWAVHNQAYLAPLRAELRRAIDVTDEEIEQWFASHHSDYDQPARLTLWNIFRLHTAPDRTQDTLDFLAGLKAEYEAGRPFDHLAREHSQSETRLRGGLVRTVAETDLPDRLAKVAFALEEGELSDPILVRDGAVLLLARNRIPGLEATLESARTQIRRDLTVQKLDKLLDERASHYQPSAEDLILDEAALLAELDAASAEDDGDRVVLTIGKQSLSASDLRSAAGLTADQRVDELDAAGKEHLLSMYGEHRRTMALVAALMSSADDQARTRAEETIRDRALPLLVDRILREEMEAAVDRDPAVLRQYFEDNRAHYQSTLRFDLEIWELPFGADPPGQLRSMEELQRTLVAGDLDLSEAVDSLGGSIRDLGWRSFDDLSSEMPGKAREYLLVGASAYSVPYQQDQALHVIHVRNRQEPGPVQYDEVAEIVRDDYVERFEQRLFTQVADVRLEAAGYSFSEDTLRALLTRGSTGKNE